MHTPNDNCWNISEIIEQQALRHPAAPAIILAERIITNRELVNAMHAIGHTLLAHGVRRGQAVGLAIQQTPLHLLAMLALARIGAVSVPVPPALPEIQRRQIVRLFQVQAIVSGRAESRLPDVPFIDIGQPDLATTPEPLPPCGSGPDDPFRLAMSSGTTGGTPKGVMYSHGYMREFIAALSAAVPVAPHSRLMPMDLHFSAGFANALWMLANGGAIVLGHAATPANMAYMVRAHAVSHWILSPGMAEDIARLLTEEDIHFPTVSHLRILGAPPGPRLLDTLFTRFTPAVFEFYGCSEIGDVAMAPPAVLQRAPGSAGHVLPWLTAQIVDEHDQPLAAGQAGRLRLKPCGRIMTQGYAGAPDFSAERFRDGWYYPRDLARIDPDGLLYILRREDDVINLGGEKFHPADVETALRSHPALREAAVFVLPDATARGTLAVAFTASEPLAQALLPWALPLLGSHCPKLAFQVQDFPRTATGKIKRSELAAWVRSSPASG